MKPLIEAREILYMLGMVGVCAGVWGEFGWTWAAIAVGCALTATAVFPKLRGH